MTTHSLSTHTVTGRPLAGTGAGRRTLAVLFVVGLLAERTLSFWHPQPGAGDTFGYDYLAGVRTTWWAMHLFGGVGNAIEITSFSLAVCLLAARRGAVWAAVGTALAAVGGVLFAAGLSAEGSVYAYAADSTALPIPTGTTFLAYVEANYGQILAGIASGGLLMAVGSLVLAVALWRSATVPRWLVLLFVAGNVFSAVFPFGLVPQLVASVTLNLPAAIVVWWATLRLPAEPEQA